MKVETLDELDAAPLSSEEVTVSHRPWFNKGDRDEYEADRRWPTVPRLESLPNRLFPVTIDLTLLVVVGIVVGAILILT
jgi:hypothetical protein